MRSTRLREFLLLFGLCAFLFFFQLSSLGLVGPDEPRYAQVAREMLAAGNWITPTLYGHAWLEKPILLYWGEMLSYALFGVVDWAARVPSALAATLLVCGTYFAVRRVRANARLDAALMTGSSVLVLAFAHAASTDMLLASAFSLSLLAWFVWYHQEFDAPADAASPCTERFVARLPLLAFYAFNAVAMLAKGPVAPVLAAIIVLAFLHVERNHRALWRSLDPLGILLFVAIAAPWYVLVQMRTPEFFRVFILEHNLARFGSNLYRHRQSFWYYLPVAIVATVPWTAFLYHGLRDAGFALWQRLRHQVATAETRESSGAPSYRFEVFLLLWAAIPIVFFSLSHSKLPGYILPAVPALLILCALSAHRRAVSDERPSRAVVVGHGVLVAILAAGVCLAPQLIFKLSLTPATLLIAALAATLVFLLIVLMLFTAGWRMLHFVTLLPLILILGFLLRGVAPACDKRSSTRPLAELIAQVADPHAQPIATYGLNRSVNFGLAFYLNQPVSAYEGLEVSPAVFVMPSQVPAAAHLLIVADRSLEEAQRQLAGRQMRLIGSDFVQHVVLFEVSAAGAEETH